MTSVPPKLPKNPVDGTEIADRTGNIWYYDTRENQWTFKGTVGSPPDVTESVDGLVTPAVYNRLRTLDEIKSSSATFRTLKISPALNAYWYYLISTNKTIKFSPESESVLRIEANRGKILGLLSQYKCPGERGDKGKTGVKGRSGKAGPRETINLAETNDKEIIIDSDVTVLTTTPISLRLFEVGSDVILLDVRLSVIDGSISLVTNDIETSGISLVYEDGRIKGSIILTNEFSNQWQYKVGQVGLKGKRGEPGNDFLEIIPNNFDDNTLRSTTALVSLRRGNTRNDLYYLMSELFTKNCVNKISILNSTITARPLDKLNLLSVSPTTDECKDITKFVFVPEEYNTPELQLPHWTPVDSCWHQRFWNISQYDWQKLTNVPAEVMRWQQANSRSSRDPQYPFSIVTPTMPGEKCCQEDMFFCSNVNDELCGIDVHNSAGALIPDQQPLCCECDCPIGLLRDVNGVYNFPLLGASSNGVSSIGNNESFGSSKSSSIVCTLDGSVHYYRQRVYVDSSNELQVSLRAQLISDDLCEPARANAIAMAGSIPSFGACPPPGSDSGTRWSIRDITSSSGMSVYVGPRDQLKTIGQAANIDYRGTDGIIDIEVAVNLTQLDVCSAYKLIITVSERDSADVPADESPSPSRSMSFSPSHSHSRSHSPSIEYVQSVSPSMSPSFSYSPSISHSPSISFSPSFSASHSLSFSASPSFSASHSISVSPSPSDGLPSASPSAEYACSCNDADPPASYSVQFTGVVTNGCGTCNTYNTTPIAITPPFVGSCNWSGNAPCGHYLTYGAFTGSPGFIILYLTIFEDNTMSTILAQLSLGFADDGNGRYDCSAPRVFSFDAFGPNITTDCDFSAATATVTV